jgi:uncharacterized protein YbjT (DUF2867 family)
MEVWLSPALGFDYANRRARIFGSGDGKQPWIALADVLAYTVGSLESEGARNAVLDIGGPDALSQRDIVRLFEEAGTGPFTLEQVPEEALQAQHAGADDPLQKSFAGLMLATARGMQLDLAPGLKAIPLAQRTSVRDHVRRVLS